MQKNYPKDYFTLVQENERLLDKPLKTKQLSYFQDAMSRFGKNKYNLIATCILGVMILMSIFVPVFTPPSYYNDINNDLIALPPRMPILENFGIFDGTTTIRNRPVDVYDAERDIWYPDSDTIHPEYIFMDTVVNHQIIDDDASPRFVGGTNIIYVDFSYKSFSIASPNVTFADDLLLAIDVVAMSEDTKLLVYYADQESSEFYDDWSELTLLGEVNSIGKTTINPLTTIAPDSVGKIVIRMLLEEASLLGTDFIELESVILETAGGTVDTEFSGHPLSVFQGWTIDPLEDSGRYARSNAVMTVADFKYNAYEALKAPRQDIIGESAYNKILADNPGMAQAKRPHPSDPLNPNMWIFEGDYPIKEVTDIEVRVIGGIVYFNYTVMKDGLYALGFDNTPYFVFGTDAFGRDLFVLLWLGLRTSLVMGVLGSLVNITIGIIWGAVSAYYGGQVDLLMERFVDIWGSFPQITMIGIITVLIGPGFLALFIFIVYDGWIGAAAVTRLQFYRYRGREYVLAARTLGASDARIIFKHILPNALGTIVTRVILSIPSVIFLEVNLSFLGFGIGNGQALKIGSLELTGTSIGVILSDGREQLIAGNYWMIIAPTFIVSLLMITFNMFGNALRDALNPQLRGNS